MQIIPGLFGENLAAFAYTLFLFIFLLMVFTEAAVMSLMKYNRFKKAFIDSLLANIVSAGSVMLVVLCFFTGKLPSYSLTNILLLFAIALVVESTALCFLSPSKPVVKTLVVCTAMNGVTFVLLYFSSVIFN